MSDVDYPLNAGTGTGVLPVHLAEAKKGGVVTPAFVQVPSALTGVRSVA